MSLSDLNGAQAYIVEEIGLNIAGLPSLRTREGVIRVKITFDVNQTDGVVFSTRFFAVGILLNACILFCLSYSGRCRSAGGFCGRM